MPTPKPRRILTREGVVENHHDAVAPAMIDAGAVRIDELAHLLVIGLEELDGLLRLRRLAERGEAADIAEQNADQRPVTAKNILFAGRDHRIRHLRREEPLQPPHSLDLTHLLAHTNFERLIQRLHFARAILQGAELTDVLDRDDRLGGEGFNQRNVAVVERAHLAPMQHNTADPLSFRNERHHQKGANPFIINHLPPGRVTFAVEVVVGHIRDMNNRLLPDSLRYRHRAVEGPFFAGAEEPVRLSPRGYPFRVFPRAINQMQDSIRRPAEPRGTLQNGGEHRQFVVPALADDREDLPRRFLPLQPGLEFAELAHVLDGDDGLGGEGLDQNNLVLRKWLYFTTP